ncbi:MAG: hypothetical protein CSA72_10510 [Rhodobacterales bacterium]|nr:MAG: hypothetical protein CSA72_10510 [Rhodobacterales bacterium]
MAFERVRSGNGQPRMVCRCEDCGRDETVCADHGSGGEAQAAKKLQAQGWTFIGKHLRCGSCSAKRRAARAAEKKAESDDANAPREPTRQQKREIMEILEDVYDVDAGCYKGGETDDTVADLLDVLPGWVARLRDEFFGPSGANADIAALREELTQALNSASAIATSFSDRLADLRAAMDGMKAMAERLAKIEKAVGPRVMRKVGR